MEISSIIVLLTFLHGFIRTCIPKLIAGSAPYEKLYQMVT